MKSSSKIGKLHGRGLTRLVDPSLNSQFSQRSFKENFCTLDAPVKGNGGFEFIGIDSLSELKLVLWWIFGKISGCWALKWRGDVNHLICGLQRNCEILH